MKYQLVLQFSADSIADFDRLVALETKLIEELGESATVDGHDFGWGKFNIFILTDEPVTAFTQAHNVVLNEGIVKDLRSAYRKTDREDLYSSLAVAAHQIQRFVGGSPPNRLQ